MIPAGTLDDTSWVKPTMQIYCDSAQPWVETRRRHAAFCEDARAGLTAHRAAAESSITISAICWKAPRTSPV